MYTKSNLCSVLVSSSGPGAPTANFRSNMWKQPFFRGPRPQVARNESWQKVGHQITKVVLQLLCTKQFNTSRKILTLTLSFKQTTRGLFEYVHNIKSNFNCKIKMHNSVLHALNGHGHWLQPQLSHFSLYNWDHLIR